MAYSIDARKELRIAAGVITHQCKHELPSCLARVRPFVEDLIVVNTGSDDRTALVAREYGASVIDATPADLDTLRNVARSATNADWIVWLDSAQWIDEQDAERVRSFLEGQPDEAKEVYLIATTPRMSGSPATRAERFCCLRTGKETPRNKTASVVVDVIILSYCKSRIQYDMTWRCIDSLHRSDSGLAFNVILIETGTQDTLRAFAGSDEPFGGRCTVVHPGKAFNYNEFLQFGYAQLVNSQADYMLIANNDVVFYPRSVQTLIGGLEQFDSVSPWCPSFHDQYFDRTKPFYPGYRTSREVCGWTLMFRKSMLSKVPFEALFPIDFAFWFQDNYYAHQLQRHGLTHGLVTAAQVEHLFEQSHGLMDPERRSDVTVGAERVYEEKIQQEVHQSEIRLTVAIAAVPAGVRRELPDIFLKLCRQAEGRPVEVLGLLENDVSLLGRKRNALADLAQGEFIAFVDIGDDVTDDYLETLLSAINREPQVDCIAFNAWVTRDGQGEGMVCRYGTQYQNVDRPDGYYRLPNQICCFRTELARRVRRHNVTEGGDSRWAADVRSRICKEVRRDKVLYHNRAHSAQLQCAPADQILATPHGDVSHRPVDLTIGILSVPSRVSGPLPALVERLCSMARGRSVEVLVLLDNKRRTVGSKRNAILDLARGRYVSFIDDDDWVADNYIDALIEAIHSQSGLDCVVFDAWVTQDGKGGKVCHYGMEYTDEDRTDAYYRKPNHICCFRTELARSVKFPDVSWHEDFQFANRLIRKLQTQVRVPQTLYHYRFSVQGSETYLAANPELRNRLTATADSVPQEQHRATSHVTVSEAHNDVFSRPIYGFWHIATMRHWRAVVEDQLLKLRASGLYEKSSRIFVGVVGPEAALFEPPDEKFQIIYRSPDLSDAEFPTLDFLHEFSQRQTSLIYYFHTKGVSHPGDRCRDWRNLLDHFVILRHEQCILALADHDTCGVNWHLTPTPHYSGNYWWARSEYVARLASISVSKREGRAACERWIGTTPSIKAACVHESNVDHFVKAYPRARYATLDTVVPRSGLDTASSWRGLENRFQDLIEPIGAVDRIVEIGVENGFGLFSLASAAKRATVIGVDPNQWLQAAEADGIRALGWEGDVGNHQADRWVTEHVSQYPNITLLHCTGEEAAALIGNQIDVVHLDAVPTYNGVARLFAAWEPKLRPGGCMLFHDTVLFADEVGRFFHELRGRKAEIRDCHGLGAWYKPSHSECPVKSIAVSGFEKTSVNLQGQTT